MKNKLKIVAALCALVMSVSAVAPANAYSEDEVCNLESRILEAESFVKTRISNAADLVRSEEQKKLANAKSKFYNEKNTLLSGTTDATSTIFDELHAVVNDVYGKITRQRITLDFFSLNANNMGLTVAYINNNLHNTFDPATHKYFDSNQALKSRMHLLQSRVFELDGRLCDIDSKLASMSGSHQIVSDNFNTLHAESQTIKNEFCDKFGEIAYANIPSDSCPGTNDSKIGSANQAYGWIISLINRTHERINSLSSKVEKLYKATEVLNEGVYKLRSKLNNAQCLDIAGGSCNDGGNLQLYHSMDSDAQKFKLVYDINNDAFKIYPACVYGKALDVQAAGQYSGVNVQQWADYVGAFSQLWQIVPSDEGSYFRIISKCNGLCLDVAGGNSTDDTNVQCWTPNGTDAQKFSFEKIG